MAHQISHSKGMKWKENAQDHRFGHAHVIGNIILALVPKIFRCVFCKYVNKLIFTRNCHFQLWVEWGKMNESKLLFMRKIFQKKNSMPFHTTYFCPLETGVSTKSHFNNGNWCVNMDISSHFWPAKHSRNYVRAFSFELTTVLLFSSAEAIML